MARILFLHGLDARPGGIKPTYLTSQGHDVANPALPRDDFPASVHIANQECRAFLPEIIVGSSRGGAVALAMAPHVLPVVLLAPAWRFFEANWHFPQRVRILHSPVDALIPYAHSIELLPLLSADAELLPTGTEHTLNDPESLARLEQVIQDLLMKP